MTSAYTLLVLALQLLTLVTTTPNISPALRDQAVSVAHAAIAAANTPTAPVFSGTQSTPSVVPVPVSATISVSMQPSISAEIVHIAPADVQNSVPHGIYVIRARVLDADGNTTPGVPITMTADGVSKQKTIDTRATPESSDYYTSFEYIPESAGAKTIDFASGNTSFSLSVNVQ